MLLESVQRRCHAALNQLSHRTMQALYHSVAPDLSNFYGPLKSYIKHLCFLRSEGNHFPRQKKPVLTDWSGNRWGRSEGGFLAKKPGGSAISAIIPSLMTEGTTVLAVDLVLNLIGLATLGRNPVLWPFFIPPPTLLGPDCSRSHMGHMCTFYQSNSHFAQVSFQ